MHSFLAIRVDLISVSVFQTFNTNSCNFVNGITKFISLFHHGYFKQTKRSFVLLSSKKFTSQIITSFFFNSYTNFSAIIIHKRIKIPYRHQLYTHTKTNYKRFFLFCRPNKNRFNKLPNKKKNQKTIKHNNPITNRTNPLRKNVKRYLNISNNQS